jgi:arsenate reductase (thioredoxin)
MQSGRKSPKSRVMTRYNVLFLCTGNSARSIMAECLMEHWGKGRFQAYSAGSHPTGKVNPLAIEMLAKARLRTDGLRSKAWDEFAAPGAPNLDFVFTVCDQAAGEICPVWPGKPITAHWGIPDPAAVIGSDEQRQRAFREAFRVLENRIKLFASLPVEKLDRLTLTRKVQEIGKNPAPAQ